MKTNLLSLTLITNPRGTFNHALRVLSYMQMLLGASSDGSINSSAHSTAKEISKSSQMNPVWNPAIKGLVASYNLSERDNNTTGSVLTLDQL